MNQCYYLYGFSYYMFDSQFVRMLVGIHCLTKKWFILKLIKKSKREC